MASKTESTDRNLDVGQTIYFLSEKEVTEYCKKNGNLKWVVYQGVVYDVTEYMPTHPGGSDIIEPYLGKSIDDPFEEQEHTQSARNLFHDLPKKGIVKGATHNHSDSDTQASEKGASNVGQGIEGLYGYQLKGKWQPDYNRGLLWQLWTSNISFADYVKYIEEPKHLINPVRNIILFENPFLEIFTKTPWYVIPIFWSYFVITYLMKNELDNISSFFYFFFGIVNWTLLEYTIHRFVFHGEDKWLPDNRVGKFLHFLLHGIHHAYPQDDLRLVFPPLPGYIIMIQIVVPIYTLFTPLWMQPTLFAGTLVGYVMYDLVHYFLHHINPKSEYWKDLKIYHMQHHYKDGMLGYGVSQKFWDLVFDTELKY